jgi:alpha-ketoglutaric semialdehyde dehydrogenase
MAQQHKNFIGGEWVEPATGEYFENRNPAAVDDLIGLWPRSGREDVERAVEAAPEGFEVWRRTPPRARRGAQAGRRPAHAAQGGDRARRHPRDGQGAAETRGDVQEGIDTAYYAATEGRRLFGHTVPSELATSGR